MTTITWRGTATATASIAHGGETRGTITLLRRELVLAPDGTTTYIPIISGNGLRGLLRRTGEQLLREVLAYDGQLPLAVVHALRSGGALAKTGREPLSGHRLATLRALIPHIGVFGCAGGGRIIDGCLQVGKVIPHLVETAHILDQPGQNLLPAFEATQIESYIRQDDSDTHALVGVTTSPVDPATGELTPAAEEHTDSLLMLYSIETFPAGTRFATWFRLTHSTPLEAAFFNDVLDTYTATAHLGGRAAIGHGSTRFDLTRTPHTDPRDDLDWRTHLTTHRAQALAALETLQ